MGLVIRFDRIITKDEAVFARDGNQVFVSGAPTTLSQDKDLIVLAGRVAGNKGLIDPSGNEALVPALDYVAAVKCGNVCQGLDEQQPLQGPRYPTVGLEK